MDASTATPNGRRTVLNAIIVGRDPFATALPAAEVHWHIIWLAHHQLIDVTPDGLRARARRRRRRRRRTPVAA